MRRTDLAVACFERAAVVPIEAPLCGIYFLVHERQVVYVGQSRNVVARAWLHAGAGRQFDSLRFLPVPQDRLAAVEGALIRALRPPLNARTARGGFSNARGRPSDDASVLASVAGSGPENARPERESEPVSD